MKNRTSLKKICIHTLFSKLVSLNIPIFLSIFHSLFLFFESPYSYSLVFPIFILWLYFFHISQIILSAPVLQNKFRMNFQPNFIPTSFVILS